MERIVGRLYDCLDDVAAIEVVLSEYRAELNAATALFAVVDRLRSRAIVIRSINLPEPDFSRYQTLIPTDPWVRAATRIPRPSVYLGTALVDQRDIVRSLMYQELMKPNNLHFMIGCGYLGPSTGAYISAQRLKGKRDYSPSTVKRVGRLLPHVLRVSRLMIDRLHSAELQDTGTFAMLRIGKRGVEYTNARAIDWLERSSEISISGNQLRLKNHELNELLNRYVSTAITGGVTSMPSSALEITVGHDLGTFRLLLLPTIAARSQLGAEPAVLVIFLDAYWRLSKWRAELLGISESETQLANALVAGQSPIDYARARNRSIHTIRTHLKSLLQKLGVHTQSQLVRKLLLLSIGDRQHG